jgi:hypothetical protein
VTNEPLEAILDRAARDPILEVISLLGPYGLYQLLQKHPDGPGPFRTRPLYRGICDLCLDITDLPELVERARAGLGDPGFQRSLAAARLWWKTQRPQPAPAPARIRAFEAARPAATSPSP